MTIAELKTALEGITGYAEKVAYWAFPTGAAPELPFVCFFETGSRNFDADGAVYHEIKAVQIELYCKQRTITEERKLEAVLKNNGIPWEKTVDHLDDEQCFMTTYSVEV